MEDRKNLEVLKRLVEKDVLDVEEKEAVNAAIGVLSWVLLSKSRIQNLKTKRQKSTEW